MSAAPSTVGGVPYDDLVEGKVSSYSFKLVDLADKKEVNSPGKEQYVIGSFHGAVNTLVKQIDEIFADIETQQADKEIKSFIIGKSHARRRERSRAYIKNTQNFARSYRKKAQKFDRRDKNTWRLDNGANRRWREEYAKNGYHGLIVLTAVTTDIIPSQVRQAHPHLLKGELYALALEQQLIQYFMMKRLDSRLKNKSFHPGNRCVAQPYAGLVYVAYELKDRADSEEALMEDQDPAEEFKHQKLHVAEPTANDFKDFSLETCISVSQVAVIDHKGGKIQLPNTCAAIRVPEGAIPPGESVEISVSANWDEKYVPALNPSDFVIGPSIQCKPDGLRFKKPVQITFPHSAKRITADQLEIWTKETHDGEWTMTWPKPADSDKDVSVIVKGKKVKLQVRHFSIYALIHTAKSAVYSLFGGRPTVQLVMLPFMHPSNLQEECVFIKVYAVREDAAEPVRLQARRCQWKQCCMMIPFDLKLVDHMVKNSSDDLHLTAELTKPSCNKWEPQTIEEKIPFSKLQTGTMQSKCIMTFTKTTNVNGIMGMFKATYNSELIGDELFGNTQCDSHPNMSGDEDASCEHLTHMDRGASTSTMDLEETISKRTSKRKLDSQAGPSQATKRTKKAVDKFDVLAVTHKVGLSSDQLKHLYQVLCLQNADIENAMRTADTRNFKLQGVKVLEHWQSCNGNDATRQAIIDALTECGDCRDAIEKLTTRWQLDLP